jgi:hypothetical protein
LKKTASICAFLSALLLLTLATTQVVSSVNANMYAEATTPPPEGTTPPTITVTTSENESAIQLLVNIASASCPTKYSMFSLPEVYYKGDWMTNESFADYGYTLTLPLYNASNGTHIVIVRAEQGCFYGNEDGVPYYFRINNSLLVKFIVEDTQPFSAKILATFNLDTTPPKVTVLSIEDKTFASSDVPLDFTVSDLVTQVSYSLDGDDNVTIAGNTTLTRLSNGEHNVTVYYADIVGNVGASVTLYFTVAVPNSFPTTLVIIASLALVGVGLLVYFKTRKHQSIPSSTIPNND